MLTPADKLNALIENYKLVNEEVKSYLSEMIRCFLYAVAVISIGLGYGITTDNSKYLVKIIDYMPFALIGLIIYFLTLGTMYVSASRYKAQVESKINKIAGENLFEYDSIFKPEIMRLGFLPNSKGKKVYPLPNPILGLVVLAAFFLLVSKSTILNNSTYISYFIAGGILISLLSIYVFVFIPKIIEKYQKKKGFM